MLAACGGDDGNGGGGALTLEQYFQSGEEIASDIEGRLGRQEPDLEGVEDTGVVIERLQDSFGESRSILQEGLDRLRALEPPSEVADLHSRFVETSPAG